LELLTRLNPKNIVTHRSTGAGWALWASISTILALALDLFAQQILSFPIRSVPAETGHMASISSTQIYDTGTGAGVTCRWQKNVDMAMQGAVMNGLYTIDSSMTFTCTTANCTWPTFYTIGVCSSCTNVTGYTQAICSPKTKTQSFNYTLPSALKFKSSHRVSSRGGTVTTLNATARIEYNVTDRLVDLGIIRISCAYENPEAFDCQLSSCAKRYSQVEVFNGKMPMPDIQTLTKDVHRG
jgi:hypothetical protein